EALLLGLEKPVFLAMVKSFAMPLMGRARIFDDGCQGTVGKREPSWIFSLESVREDTQGIGVAFEGDQVFPLRGCHLTFQLALICNKIGGNGRFARVAKGGIPKIMRQAGRGDDGIDVLEQRDIAIHLGVVLAVFVVENASKRTPYAGYFQAMG